MDAEAAERQKAIDEQRATMEAEMKRLQDEVNQKHSDEEAQKAAQVAAAKAEAEMKYKLEQDRLNFEREQKEREEKIRQEEAAIKRKQAEFAALEGKLGKVLPMVNEANLIAKELKRDIQFEVNLVKNMPSDSSSMAEARTEIFVRVNNKEDGWYNMWDQDKFDSRMMMMRDNLNQFFDTDKMPDFSDKDKDAWWDPCKPVQVGTAYLNTKNMTYMLDNELSAKIVSASKGNSVNRGVLAVNLEPTDVAEEIEDAEDAEELLGK